MVGCVSGLGWDVFFREGRFFGGGGVGFGLGCFDFFFRVLRGRLEFRFFFKDSFLLSVFW